MNASYFSEHCKVEEGVLAVSASASEVTADAATSMYEWARENEEFHSLLIYGSTVYEEPYYGTVRPWVEGLINSNIDCLRNFKIDEGTVMNRQFGNYIGDITPILKKNSSLSVLLLCGSFNCSNYSHNSLQHLCVSNCLLNSEDLQTLSTAKLPSLERIALYDGDAGLSNAEFNSLLVESLSKIRAEKLSEIFLCDWGVCDDFLDKLCTTDVLSQLKLLHIDGFEFGYDPEESLALLLSSADKLGKLTTLRIPFKGFMEEEIAQLVDRIPGLENSRPPGERIYSPFNGG